MLEEIRTHKFGSTCDVNTDCTKGLACDVRQHPITNTCLIKLGGTCHKDLDCVNGLECKNGRCGCNVNLKVLNFGLPNDLTNILFLK